MFQWETRIHQLDLYAGHEEKMVGLGTDLGVEVEETSLKWELQGVDEALGWEIIYTVPRQNSCQVKAVSLGLFV